MFEIPLKILYLSMRRYIRKILGSNFNHYDKAPI